MNFTIVPEATIHPRSMDARDKLKARIAVAAATLLSLLPPYLIALFLKRTMRDAEQSTPAQSIVARSQICTVSPRCAGQGCLQRSLATVILCRISGHCPSWKTGYQIEPFRAHAWVEVSGVPINEPAEVNSYITTLELQPPRPAQAARSTFLSALRSELSKLATLRAPLLTIALTTLLVAGLSLVLTMAANDAFAQGHPEQMAGLEPASAFLVPLYYGQIGAILFACWLVIEEQGAGNLRMTLLALPRRSIVFQAKALVALAGGLCLGVLAVLGAYGLRCAVVGDVPIGEAALSDARILVGYIVYWALLAVLSYAVASLLRNGIAALGGMLCLVFIASPFLLSQTSLARFLPDQAGAQMSLERVASGADLGPWLGFLVMLAWTGLLFFVGYLCMKALQVRD